MSAGAGGARTTSCECSWCFLLSYCQHSGGCKTGYCHERILGWKNGALFCGCPDIFNPYAPSNTGSTATAYRRHDYIKRRAYGQRVREVEHASLTPIVMFATGGLAPEATTFYWFPAFLLASKWGDACCVVMGWLRCSLGFSLL